MSEMTLDEAMLGRFIDGNPTKGDLAVADLCSGAGWGYTLMERAIMKGFFKSLELPVALGACSEH